MPSAIALLWFYAAHLNNLINRTIRGYFAFCPFTTKTHNILAVVRTFSRV